MRWNVDPILIDLGPVAIRYYGVFFASGVFLAATMMSRIFRRRGYPNEQAISLSIWLLVGMMLGAHLLHLAFYEPRSFFERPIRIIQIGYGLSSHGSAVGAVLALIWFCRRHKLSFHAYADAVMASVVWVFPFIRTGNFFNSEIVGRPTSVPWGVVFARRFSEPRHPSQLYEVLLGCALILLAIRRERQWQRHASGTTLYWVLTVYFVARFALEYFKEYQVLSADFPLTMGQLLSLPMALLCAAGLRYRRRRADGADPT